MNEEHKSPFKSSTIWGSIGLAIIGLLAIFDIQIAEGEINQVIMAFGTIFTFAVTVYGRIKARVPVKFFTDIKWPWANLIVATLLIGSLVAVTPGCQNGQLTERGREALEGAAKIAMIIGLDQLTSKVTELEPYKESLQAVINVAFADQSDPALIGQQIKSGVEAVLPSEVDRALVLSWLSTELVNPKGADTQVSPYDAETPSMTRAPVGGAQGVTDTQYRYNLKIAEAL